MLDSTRTQRPPLPADSRADQRPGPRAARDRPADDRPSRPGVRALGARGPRRAEDASSRPGRPVVIYPASGTGAWEAALVNTLSPGDRVLMFETGHFATLWREMAERLGLVVDFVPATGASGVDPARVEAQARRRPRARDQGGLRRPQRDLDGRHQPHRRRPRRRSIAPGIRRCSWSTRSRSLASIDYRHDEWGVDVTVAGSQKGLMLPPGLSFNAVSDKALAASEDGEAAAHRTGAGTR